MQLPADLRRRIEDILSDQSRKILAEAATDVSLKYRREAPQADLQIASVLEAKAYLATRLPATWCAVSNVIQKLLEVSPKFNPASCLDLGAGPGTASLAAQNFWPSLKATLVEPNPHLRTLGRALGDFEWVSDRLQTFTPDRKYDLVIASYVFNELAIELDTILAKIWAASTDVFIMIEPGTPQGYETILKARDYFIAAGAHIAAPCPHQLECPLRKTDRWCHFAVRVERSRLHLQTKADAHLPYEDEKFSYLVVTRAPVARPVFRTLGYPHGQKVVRLETCQDDGTFDIAEFSKRSPVYRQARKMDWGDAFFAKDDTSGE